MSVKPSCRAWAMPASSSVRRPWEFPGRPAPAVVRAADRFMHKSSHGTARFRSGGMLVCMNLENWPPADKRLIFQLQVRKSHLTASVPLQRRPLPPLNAVRAFEAAARHGSFKDAAAELGVTHGAISRQIRLLEDWLGAPALFHRLNRRVALTPGGDALLAEFGPALDRIATAARQHREGRGELAAMVVRVNALATFSLRWLLPRLTLFRTEYPGIEVQLTTANEPVDALAEDYDVVIRGGPDTFHGFVARLLLSECRLPV